MKVFAILCFLGLLAVSLSMPTEKESIAYRNLLKKEYGVDDRELDQALDEVLKELNDESGDGEDIDITGGKPAKQPQRPAKLPGVSKPDDDDSESVEEPPKPPKKSGNRPQKPGFQAKPGKDSSEEWDGERPDTEHPQEKSKELIDFIITILASPYMKAKALDNDELESAYKQLHQIFDTAIRSLLKAANDAKNTDVAALTHQQKKDMLASMETLFGDIGKSLTPVLVLLLRDYVYGIDHSLVCDLSADDATLCVAQKVHEVFQMAVTPPKDADKKCDKLKTFLSTNDHATPIEIRDGLAADVKCLAKKLQSFKASIEEFKVMQKLNNAAGDLDTADDLNIGVIMNGEMDKLAKMLRSAYYHGQKVLDTIDFLKKHL